MYFNFVKMYELILFKKAFNSTVRKLDIEPSKIILLSVGSTIVICKLWAAYNDCTEGIIKATKKKIFKIIRFEEFLHDINR